MSKNIANYVGYSTEMEYKSGDGNKGIWTFFHQIFFKYRGEWKLYDPFSDGTIVLSVVYTSPTVIPGPSRAPQPSKIEIIAAGAGGGHDTYLLLGGGATLPTSQTGGAGQGGFTAARFDIPSSQDIVVAVGTSGIGANGYAYSTTSPGAGGVSYPPGVGVGGPANPSGYPGQYGGGGGGGFSGVFAVPPASPVVPAINQGNALLIAGGGGGNRYSGGIGGNGGGLTADAAPNPGTGGGGGGGTQIGGGSGGTNQPGSPPITSGSGTALNGGINGAGPEPAWAYGGGGGGAGYFGGGGGGGSSSSSGSNSGGGGGGSGYLNTGSPYYVVSPFNRTNVGMGDPTMGTGLTPAPPGGPTWSPGLGKDHPQIAPYWASNPTKYGAGQTPGVVIINYYG
jgi:hypothetical protein